MTPLGLNTAAVPETAALFPLSAATPPAAEGSSSNGGAASSAFGDLLAATYAQSEQPQDVLGADLATTGFNTLSLADAWFAGLNVDLDALNASLEAEEAGLSADADGADDDAAALMALAVSIPAAVPAWSMPLPVDESAPVPSESRLPDLLVERALSALPAEPQGLAPQMKTADASSKESAAVAAAVDAVTGNVKVEDVPVGQALSGLPGEPERLAAQASATAAVAQKPLAPQLADVQEPEVSVQESPVEEQPAGQLPRAIESAPAMQQTGRTRESVAAKLAEISGLGLGGEAVAKPAPGTSFDADSQSQSQTQDGGTQDAFALGLKESAIPARPVDGAAAPPVFSVAAPVAGPARAVVVEGATLPAPPAATVPGPENVGRLIESMRVQMRQGVQEATVRLNPEHLGEVTISVRVERGAVSAVVNAETPAVQQWLESQEDKLRSGLSDQGLHLAKFIVQRDGSQQHREQPQQQKQPVRDRQQLDGAPIRFEVIV